ncbi:MAG: M60 family metallopeptidase [Phycisphaerae bacterium]|nr:M60 family metallopeptidase [Phycisphaerae bacterium]
MRSSKHVYNFCLYLFLITIAFSGTVYSGEPLLAGSDMFSVNFYAYGALNQADYESVTLEAGEAAGFGSWNTTGWENIEVPWGMSSPRTPVTFKSVEGAKATFTFNDARNGGPYVWNAPHTNLPGNGNGDLMDGHANGTLEDPGDTSQIFDMTVSDFPYGAYDVIIYIGANQAQFGNGKGKIVFNGGPEQDFTLKSGEFTTFTEIVNGTTPGNYIVFEGVTGSSFNVKVWGNGFNHIGPTGFQIFIPDTSVTLPEDNILLALSELKSHVEGTITLSSSQIAAHKSTIDTDRFLFELSENVMTAAFELVSSYETIKGPFFINSKTSGGFEREQQAGDGFELERVIYTVQQTIHDFTFSPENCQNRKTLLNGKKFETSDFFPGACVAPANPQIFYNVQINATLPEVWGIPVAFATDPVRRPTGFYLAPGSFGKVTVPPEMVDQGFEILVGAHTWDKSNKSKIERFDRVTKSFPITRETTKIANPFGGGIYIVIPYKADLGVVTVQIANAARSPLFSATSIKKTSSLQWSFKERQYPGPWADFESDKFMMQVPTSWIYNFDDPVTLMRDWDLAMDGFSEILGFPLVRNRTVLYVQPDISIAHGVYGIGYPQVNQGYNPNSSTNGNSSHFFLTNPIGWSTTYHELGHAQLFSKFPGHAESMVNLPYVYIATEKFGVDLVTAFTNSVTSDRENMTIDNAATMWFVTENFRNGNPMDITNTTKNQVRYQHRGYGRYVEIATLFGWDVLKDFYYHENLDYMAGTPGDGLHSVDSRILRLSREAGVDLTPLIHCWGVQPVNLGALQAAIEAEGLSRSKKIYDRLVHYKDIIPANNAEFLAHYHTVYPNAPDEGGDPDHGYGWYNVWKSIYNDSHGTAAKSAMQDIIDLYFPYGRPDINIGKNMITWSGKPVQMDPVFTSGFSPTTFAWTADPAAGVVFNPNANVESPTITVTKATANPSVIAIKLIADGSDGPDEDFMTLNVYDDACKAAIGKGLSADHPADLDGDCMTNLADFAILPTASLEDLAAMAADWLEDFTLTEPVGK